MQVTKIINALKSGKWEIRWIGDWFWESTPLSIVYYFKNLETLQEEKLFLPIDYFPILTIGMQFEIIGEGPNKKIKKPILQNTVLHRVRKHIRIEEEILRDKSKIVFSDILNSIKNKSTQEGFFFLNKENQNSFFYSQFLEINDAELTILIPSNEIARYFYLTGSKLISQLINYELSTKEISETFIINFYEYFEDKKIVEQNGQKIAYLKLVQGLTESEYQSIIGMAFFRNAFNSATEIRKALQKKKVIFTQNNSENKSKESQNSKKVLPFFKVSSIGWYSNIPFSVDVCGEYIHVENKRYFLVYQIYSVQEAFPFDKLIAVPIVDRGKDFNKESDDEIIRNPSSKQVRISSDENTKITEDKRGNSTGNTLSDFKLEIPENVITQFLPIETIRTKEQLKHYGSSEIQNIVGDYLTISQESSVDSRLASTRIKKTEQEVSDSFNKEPRFLTLTKAIKTLHNVFNISYLDYKNNLWTIFDQVNSVSPTENTVNEVGVFLVRLQSIDSLKYVYLLRLTNIGNEGIRFGLLHEYNFGEIPLEKVREYCRYFSFKRIMVKRGNFKNKYKNHTIEYSRHNQHDVPVQELSQALSLLLLNKLK